jgi:hypothetical protein
MLYQDFISGAAALSFIFLVPAHAHPGEVEPTLTSRQLERRQAAINARHAVVRKCDGAIAAFEAKRRAKRSAFSHKEPHKKPHKKGSTSCEETTTATTTGTANVPTYTTLQNVSVALTISAFLPLTSHPPDYLRTYA